MALKSEFYGTVVADPEHRKISDKFAVLEFPVYANHRVKKDGEWVDDPNRTTKVKVTLKFDLLDQFKDVLGKGDFVKVTADVCEREYEKKDGSKGRSLETDYISAFEVVRSKSGGKAEEVETPW